jgi:outer membrane protein, multidrug efflux system
MPLRIYFFVVAAALTGCAVGPNYARPSVAVPGNFRAPDPQPPHQAASLADLKWFEVFKDDRLQELIRTLNIYPCRFNSSAIRR